MASRHRHLTLVPPPSSADDECPHCGIHRRHSGNPDACGKDYRIAGCFLASKEPAPRDPVAPGEDMVIAGGSGNCSYSINVRGTSNFEFVVPGMDQPPLDPPAARGGEAAPLELVHSAPRTLALHPPWRRIMDRLRRPLLGRTPNEQTLGQRRLLRLQGRPPLTDHADAEGRARLQGERLLHVMARRPMAQHLATLLRTGLTGGTTKVW